MACVPQAGHDKNLIECAGMDFSGIPTREIARHFDVGVQTIRYWRECELYKTTVQELREEFTAKMMSLATTKKMRDMISSAMEIGVNRLIEILSSPKTRNMDLINACKLAATLDGRFLRTTPDGESERDGDIIRNEPLAQELLSSIERWRKDKEQVQ